MTDETETTRRKLIKEEGRLDRLRLTEMYGDVWDTSEVQAAFDVLGFLAPFATVRRKSDGVTGSLQFQGSPRYYHSFQEGS